MERIPSKVTKAIAKNGIHLKIDTRTQRRLQAVGKMILNGDKFYDQEGKKLIKEEQKNKNIDSGPDVIWIHPDTGGKVFVGDYKDASSLKSLKQNKIYHIVNC